MIEKIPTHEESLKAIGVNEASALHWFIQENEPVGEIGEDLFRIRLLAVVVEAQRESLQWAASRL